MPLAYPYTAYQRAGAPVTFYVGPSSTRFDVHHFALHDVSPIFSLPNGLPLIVTKPISLPNLDPDDFRILMTWLYERQPPQFTTAKGLLKYMKMWVTAGELGMWAWQNTILREAMYFMKPQEFHCSIDTVRWVYKNTPPHSPLRAYIIAVMCQRHPPITTDLFDSANEKLGIFRDAIPFVRVLQKIRGDNARDENGDQVTCWKRVDRSKVTFPLPGFFVWDAKWAPIPDKWYVSKQGAVKEAETVMEQLRKHTKGIS